ncbi:hypothetical protein AB0P02_07430 [Streptomyces griseoluteus]|uniref:hypothetical protein n=1 Tax=Streptomyces griseoluteus TaxID=29306 RepID=UPI0034285949
MTPDKTETVQNPDRELPKEVEEIAEQLEAVRAAEVASADAFALSGRPTEKERRKIAFLREQAAREIGVSEETLHDLRDLLQDIDSRVTSEERTQGLEPVPDGPTLISPDAADRVGPAPGRNVGEFWWNSSRYWWDPQLRSYDGVGKRYFGGWLRCRDGNLHTHHFGLSALYELHSNRTPPSATGRYRSAPFADMVGKLEAATGNDFLSGDNWSKCWMHLKHSLWVPIFGGLKYLGPGPQDQITNLANLSQDGQRQEIPMSRRWFFPSITFNASELYPDLSIWAYTEISFDVQLEGNGSHLYLDWDPTNRDSLGMVIPQWFIATGV